MVRVPTLTTSGDYPCPLKSAVHISGHDATAHAHPCWRRQKRCKKGWRQGNKFHDQKYFGGARAKKQKSWMGRTTRAERETARAEQQNWPSDIPCDLTGGGGKVKVKVSSCRIDVNRSHACQTSKKTKCYWCVRLIIRKPGLTCLHIWVTVILGGSYMQARLYCIIRLFSVNIFGVFVSSFLRMLSADCINIQSIVFVFSFFNIHFYDYDGLLQTHTCIIFHVKQYDYQR